MISIYKENKKLIIYNMSNKSPRSEDGYQSHYKESYPYQEPNGHDEYGNTTYTTYNERYTSQDPTGSDSYGNPTYDPDS